MSSNINRLLDKYIYKAFQLDPPIELHKALRSMSGTGTPLMKYALQQESESVSA